MLIIKGVSIWLKGKEYEIRVGIKRDVDKVWNYWFGIKY